MLTYFLSISEWFSYTVFIIDSVSDLGEFTQEMAETMLLYSHQLHEFGTQLIEDK